MLFMGRPGTTVRGKVSWFGGGIDPGNSSGTTASGVPDTVAGIAVRPGAHYTSGRPFLGGYWRVTLKNGKTAILKQIDIGPNESVGRRIDFTPAALHKLGYTTGNFPTDSIGKAVYLGRDPSKFSKVAADSGGAAGTRVVSGPQIVSSGGSSFNPASLLAAAGVGQPKVAQQVGSPLQAPVFAAQAVLPQGGVASAANLATAAPADVPAPASVTDLLAKIPQADSSLPKITSGTTATVPTARSADPAAAAAAAGHGQLGRLIDRMNAIDAKHLPYLWGGGHQGGKVNAYKATPLDCSGAVSAALGIRTRVSGELASWGLAGSGRKVTIYANDEHTFMAVKRGGKWMFWGTSQANPGGGAGWIPASQFSSSYLAQFTKRHPKGL